MYKFIILAVIVVVVGGAYLSRDTLKTYFETGDIPTQEEFKDTIDSSLNMIDDGIADIKSVTKAPVMVQTKVLTQKQTEFTLNTAQSVTFSWGPVVSKTQGSGTYRLKVWQLMQGQNSADAMRTNKPIVTKDVADLTEATVSGIYTGPCKPPYLCDYVWSVEAMSKATPTDAGTGTGAGSLPDTGTGAR
jgi:hypothetical protein